ncbi:MAG TPA: DUF523 domain-containing protein [Patescibacteria group bacterium]|jgi:uncharacterized protein YbbK (DUF523 family)|nr:DUF523 domain-containing protein [Patescibacteria group bacterium]
MNILISACLLGVNCKYNGNNNKVENIIEELQNVTLIPICPEQLGGLTTPRLPSEIVGNAKVISKEGHDVTGQFVTGAEETLKIAQLYHCRYAILKERSPSCGSNQIYDGSFQGKVKPGEGITAALLKRNGIEVYSEENFGELIDILNK